MLRRDRACSPRSTSCSRVAGWAGRSARARSTRRAPQLVGVERRRVAALAFAVGVASAGAGGAIASVLYPFLPGLALPVDRAPARHHRARRHGQPAGRGDRRALPRRGRADDGHLHRSGVGDGRAVRVRSSSCCCCGRRGSSALGCARTWPRHDGRRRDGGRRGNAQGRGRAPSSAPSSALRSPWTAVIAVAVVLVAVYPVVSDDLYYQNMVILSMVFAIGAVGLNIITGYAGYISLGQGAFVGPRRVHGRHLRRRHRWLRRGSGFRSAGVRRGACGGAARRRRDARARARRS